MSVTTAATATAAAPAPPANAHDEDTSVVAASFALAKRNLSMIPRTPATFVPNLVFPVIIVIAFSGAFTAVAELPGFPTRSMLDWILPMSIVQSASFAGFGAAFAVSRDIDAGFFDRLLTSPIPRSALVIGPTLAAMVRCLIPLVIVLAVGALSGMHLPGGLPGIGVLVLAAIGTAVMGAGWGLGLTLRMPFQAAAPLIQVGMFFAVFLSTAQVPLEVMTGWLKVVARVNPMTNVFLLARQGFVADGSVEWADTWPGLLAMTVMSALLLVFAFRGLRKKASG